MFAVNPSLIAKIDAYAKEQLAIPTHTLMQRAGEAIFSYVQTKLCKKNARILILCGGGNNGGDGYAAGRLLLEHGHLVTAVDLFSCGQRTEEGKRALRAFEETPDARLLHGAEGLAKALEKVDCVIEAVYGVGARADLPEEAVLVLSALGQLREERVNKKQTPPLFVAVDCPLGVNVLDGTAREDAFAFDATVELSFPKLGTHSYPAARYAGEFVLDTLGLPTDLIKDNFDLQNIIMDGETASKMMPHRDAEGHKGSFGTLGAVIGSAQYRGAALLAAESALRGGIGLLRYFGEREVCTALLARNPEAVCHPISPVAQMCKGDAAAFVSDSPKVSAWLIGSGCGQSEGLAHLLSAFLTSEGAPLVLDADALNLLADESYALLGLLADCKRQVLLTPHPLEFARLCRLTANEVQNNRLSLARDFAARYGVTLLLKGKGSVTASPDGRVCVNSSGNTALSKGGSGDVLAGLVASLAAQGVTLFDAAALGAYLHGRAGEELSKTLGEAGTLPSDLPMAIARLNLPSCPTTL